MILAIIPFLVGTTMGLDAATTFRKTFNPYVLYNFLDSDLNGNGNATTIAADLAGHPTINFGNVTLGPRASWLTGRPGVTLVQNPGPVINPAMSSVNNFSTAWVPTFSNPFVIEMWYQSSNPYLTSVGNFFALSRIGTLQGTTLSGNCNYTEPMMDFFVNSGEQFRVATDYCSVTCSYSNNGMRIRQANNPQVIALYMRYNPPDGNFSYWRYENTTMSKNQAVLIGDGNPIKWVDTQAKLLFSNSASTWNTFDFNLLSFAIYPDLSFAQIGTLFTQGLPNAKPFAPSFKRAVAETMGGSITLCPNVIGSSRDSDCLDYTNNAASSSRQVHTLTPTSDLVVTITQLPAQGTLSQGGVAITAVPFRLTTSTTVLYTPPKNIQSWYATWISLTNYTFTKTDYETFTYTVKDLDGALSGTGTVTLEVYPVFTPPTSLNIPDTQSNIYAGLPVSSTALDNAILLQPVNNEFLQVSSSSLTCAGLESSVSMCLNSKGSPTQSDTFVTIKTVPSIGYLQYKSGGVFYNVTVGQTIYIDTVSNCGNSGSFQPPNCPAAWIVYYQVGIDKFGGNTSAILATDSFTYTTTQSFYLAPYLGSTRYVVDSTNALANIAGTWVSSSESAPATVAINIQNGFYSLSAASPVKQHNLSTITPQAVDLIAKDVTIKNPSIKLYISSLPARGGLFLPGSTTPLKIANLPQILPNFTVFYQPSLPSEPYGLIVGPNYANFKFYAVSNGKTSNNATQYINVQDTNDPVTIFWSPTASPIPLARNGNPQKWTDLPDNGLKINFTDPDIPAPNEPYYQVSLDGGSLFYIFLPESIFTELQTGTDKSYGQRIGAGSAGAGNAQWVFIVPRDLAQRALMSVRVRPNQNSEGILTVKVKDCVNIPGVTDPSFNGADWASQEITATIIIKGSIEDKPLIVGEANQTILGVIYGVVAFIAVVFLVCGFFLVRWCLRRASHGGSSGSSSKTGGSTSSKKGKAKKAKSAYLHTVEL